MKEIVLKAVANPPQFFKAPYKLAIFNIILHTLLMLVLLTQLINPLWSMGSALFFHMILIKVYQTNPHIDNILKNIKLVMLNTKNLDKEQGNKFLN